MISRRMFVGAMAAAPLMATPLLAADEGWIPLFNGKDLDGWRPSEHKDSWKVRDGQIVGGRDAVAPVLHGARVQEFRTRGGGAGADRRATRASTSTRRTRRPDSRSRASKSRSTTRPTGEGTYRERKKTGSLYGLRNVYKQYIADDQWFKMHVLVRGKNVQVRLDGMLVVDYTEPTPPVIPAGMEKERFLDHGTFALQCHNPRSRRRASAACASVRWRTMRRRRAR